MRLDEIIKCPYCGKNGIKIPGSKDVKHFIRTKYPTGVRGFVRSSFCEPPEQEAA